VSGTSPGEGGPSGNGGGKKKTEKGAKKKWVTPERAGRLGGMHQTDNRRNKSITLGTKDREEH